MVLRRSKEVGRHCQGRAIEQQACRILGLTVDSGSELLGNGVGKEYTYRAVFRGSNVVDRDWGTAMFQDLAPSPTSVEIGKLNDAYGRMPGHAQEQADAVQAYIQEGKRGSNFGRCVDGPQGFVL